MTQAMSDHLFVTTVHKRLFLLTASWKVQKNKIRHTLISSATYYVILVKLLSLPET